MASAFSAQLSVRQIHFDCAGFLGTGSLEPSVLISSGGLGSY